MARNEISPAPMVALDPDHEIDLLHGHFQQTKRPQLDAAFSRFLGGDTRHLCVFFHGGLVSQEDGLATAYTLIDGYTQAGTYPFFFIWNSGLMTDIESYVRPHEDDPGFVLAANRAVKRTTRKIAAGFRVIGPT